MGQFEYFTPVDIATAFRSKRHVSDFIEFMIDNLIEEAVIKSERNDYLPAIVFVAKGKVFNIDYNFLVRQLAEWIGTSQNEIIGDFLLTDSQNADVFKSGKFLVVGLLEMYYGVVRINVRDVDLSKYHGRKNITLEDRFYNVVIMKRGKEYRRYSAVPFSMSVLKGMISEIHFEKLMEVVDRDCYEQAAFGLNQYRTLVSDLGFIPEPI